MSDRVSVTILLCEDKPQERLAIAFLKKCGRPTTAPQLRSIVASRQAPGGNDRWVLRQFPGELHACRQRSKKARTQIVVLIDADASTVEDRRKELDVQLKEAGHEPLNDQDEGTVVLVPRRHVETWLGCLLGESVTEEEDCKKRIKSLGQEEYNSAGGVLHDWSRPNAISGSTCVPSLCRSFPEWRKIG